MQNYFEKHIHLLLNLYQNGDGATETWTAKMTPEEFDQTIQEQFNKFKENFLKKLNGETQDEENA